MQCIIAFRSDETHAVSLWSDLKDISAKACLNGVDNNDAWILWTMKLAYKKNMMYEIIIQENQISHVFRNFPVYEQH